MATIGKVIGQATQPQKTARANYAQKQAKAGAARNKNVANNVSIFKQDLKAVNQNKSNTLTGAIKEGAQDTFKAAKSGVKAVISKRNDFYGDVADKIKKGAHTVASYAKQGLDVVKAAGGYIATGVKGFFSGLFQAGKKGAQDAINKKYD